MQLDVKYGPYLVAGQQLYQHTAIDCCTWLRLVQFSEEVTVSTAKAFALPGEPDRTRTRHHMPGKKCLPYFCLKSSYCRLQTPRRKPTETRNRTDELVRVGPGDRVKRSKIRPKVLRVPRPISVG